MPYCTSCGSQAGCFLKPSEIPSFQETPVTREESILNRKTASLRRCLADLKDLRQLVVNLGGAEPFTRARGEKLVDFEEFIEEWAAECAAILSKGERKGSQQGAYL